MNGWIITAPSAPLTATETRDAAGLIAAAETLKDTSASPRDFEVKFVIRVPATALDDVALVNGDYTIDPAGDENQKPEASGFVVAPGETAEFPQSDAGFSLINAPFHVCRESAAGADVSDVVVRVLYRKRG